MKVGEVYVDLGVDMSHYRAGLNTARSETAGLGGILRNTLSNAAGYALGMVGFQGITAAIKSSVGAGMEFNSTMQQSRIAFETMLGSAEKADALLAQLSDFAAKTPFEFPELVDASKKMLAFGFSSADVLPMLKSVGDAAAGLGMKGGEGVNRLILALGQMQAKQKVSGGEMLQLTEAGVPAWDILAKAMGKSTAEVMKLSEKGLIPADQAVKALVKGMEERFPNMMDKQSKSFAGMMSTLKDSMQITFGAVMKPVFDWLTINALPKAIELTGALSTAVSTGDWEGFLKLVFPEGFLQKVRDATQSAESMTTAIKGLVAPELAPAVDAASMVIQGLGNIVKNSANEIQTTAKLVWPDIKQAIVTAISEVSGVASAAWPLIESISTNTTSTIHGMIRTAWPNIKEVVKIAHDGIVEVVKFVWPAIQETVEFYNNQILPFVSEIWGKINAKIAEIMPDIKAVVDQYLGELKVVWETTWAAVKVAVEIIWIGIKASLNILVDAAFGVIKAALKLLQGDWSGAWDAMVQTVDDIWVDMIRALNELWTKIDEILGGWPDKALNWGKKLIQGFVDGIRSMFGSVSDAAGQAIDRVTPVMEFNSPAKEGPGRYVTQWGANMVKGFMDGMTQMAPQLRMNMAGMMSPGGSAGSTTTITGGPVTIYATVRRDDDIDRLVRQIAMHQRGQMRAVGVPR